MTCVKSTDRHYAYDNWMTAPFIDIFSHQCFHNFPFDIPYRLVLHTRNGHLFSVYTKATFFTEVTTLHEFYCIIHGRTRKSEGRAGGVAYGPI